MNRPHIAMLTPLQPVESGISLYSEELIPLLTLGVDVDVVVDGYTPSVLATNERINVRQFIGFRPEDYDLVVYQIGNSPAHLYMLDLVERHPGLLVLHDSVLNHLFVQRAAREGTLDDYRDKMERRYGRDGRRAAERVLKGQAPDDLFRFPMSESLVERSRATIVHSDYARQQAKACSPASDVFRVPHGLRLPTYVNKREARRALGLPVDQFIIASVTHLNPYKRIDTVLRAFRRLRQDFPSLLILAGSVSPNFPLGRMIVHLGLDQVVDVPGYVPDTEARLLTAAADVIVNLRYPTAGETSGSLLNGMAAGRPVMVSQVGSFTEVPDDCVLRVPVDQLEEDMVYALFRRLAEDGALADEIGRRARAFVADQHAPQRWVDGYLDTIERVTGRTLDRAKIELGEQPIAIDCRPYPSGDYQLLDEVATDIAELGLGGDDVLLSDVASGIVELGLGLGKMKPDSAPESD